MSGEEHERFEALLPAYVLGTLDAEEKHELERHLATDCELCAREMRGWSSLLAGMAEAVPPVTPSELTRSRLLRGVAERSGVRREGAKGWGLRIAASVVLALLAWGGWTQVTLRREIDRLAAARLETLERLAQMSTQLDRARSQLHQAAIANRIVASPRVQSVLLAGLAGAPGASAQALIDPLQERAVFYAANLAPAAPGTIYQLWFIVEGTPVSAGVFDVDEEGSASLIVDRVAAADTIQAWAVTIEPAGGVPQPTGVMVLKS